VNVQAADALSAARTEGRDALWDHEAFTLVRTLGFAVPAFAFVPAGSGHAPRVPGRRVVIKAAVPGVVHKTRAGALCVVENREDLVLAAIRELEARFADRNPAGCTVFEYVEHGEGPGNEFLLGARWTDDFGPVVALGPGGRYAEWTAAHLNRESGPWIFSPALTSDDEIGPRLAASARFDPVFAGDDAAALTAPLVALASFAREAIPEAVTEIEINPLVPGPHGPVVLDVFVRLGGPRPAPEAERPLSRIGNLLRPDSIAVAGVSDRMNPGRIILGNILAAGFDPGRVTVIKPGADTVDGCRAVPDAASLPEPVDLLVVSLAAGQVPALLRNVVDTRAAEAIVLIPGGMEERAEGAGLADRVRGTLAASRETAWGGPVVNGGNCLGVRSRPGRFDTLFIPREKLPARKEAPHPVALLSQSGAFAVARLSNLPWLDPRYVISFGNQIDLTAGDYLTWLRDDPEVCVAACYVEGFRPGDGTRWLRAARDFVRQGRTVVLYRAGRTPAGLAATASHTAAVAGDHRIAADLARAEGVLVADTLDEFDDLLRLTCRLGERRVGGRLGAISNAGFECVTVADNLGPFTPAAFAEATVHRLEAVYREARIEGIASVGNPADVTPILDDAAFAEAAAAVLDDPGVDTALIGCVPLTGALETLPPELGWSPEGLVSRLGRLWESSVKPWVAVVDAGPAFDRFAAALEERGIPVFRTADRALRTLARIHAANRLRSPDAHLEAPVLEQQSR